MTIDFWGLGLQAVNVLILVWLLTRVFWRPVSAAITKRQETAAAIIGKAKATQDKADAAMAEATHARSGIASERTEALDAAREEADIATKAALTEARSKADALLSAAKTTIDKNAGVARKANDAEAADLALTIAADLLGRMASPEVQSAFLAQLITAIGKTSASDRAALVGDPKGIEIVTAHDAATEGAAQRKKIIEAVQKALGGTPDLRFATDPDLIAGLELRSPHFVLRNSWQADLAQISKAVKDAA